VNSRNQSYIVYMLLFVAIIVLVIYGFNNNPTSNSVLTINQLADQVKSGNISRIIVEENKITIVDTNGATKTAIKENNSTLVDQLLALGVEPDKLSSANGLTLEVRTPSRLWDFLAQRFISFRSSPCSWSFTSFSARPRAAITLP